ncbi:MAG: putative phospholipase [Oscillospiraceae bacterium]|nr:putative phospholipase [Oscillospiraceae bacterium]
MLRGSIAMGTLEDFEPIVPEDGIMPGVRLSIRGGILTRDTLRINDESIPDALLVTSFGVTMRAAPRSHLSANNVFSFLRTLANKAYDVFITVVDDAWRFIVKVGEKIVSFIIDCTEKIAECVKEVFNLIRVKIKKLIDYLKFIFDMDDVFKTRDVLKKAFNLQISYFLSSMEHYKSKAEEFMDRLIRMAETWGDLTPLDQLSGGMGGGSHAKKFDVKAKHFCDTLSSNADKASHAAPHPATALDSYVNSIKGVSAEAMEVINTFVERIKADLIDGNAMMGMSFGAVAKSGIPVADAICSSAGFQVLIGPYKMDTTLYTWQQSDYSKDLFQKPEQYIHLWDGGVYDNLGLESVFKPDNGGTLSDGIDYLIVSNASGGLGYERRKSELSGKNSKRLLDISIDQVSALRNRSVMDFIKRTGNGMYLNIGNSAEFIAESADVPLAIKSQLMTECMPDSEALKVQHYPTTLSKLSKLDFELILRHGYEVAKCTDICYKAHALTSLG